MDAHEGYRLYRGKCRQMSEALVAEDQAKLQGVLGTSTLIQDGGRNS